MKIFSINENYDEDSYKVLLIELLLLLSLDDKKAKDYLSALDASGDLPWNLPTTTLASKPLEIITYSADDRNINIFSLDLCCLLDGGAIPSRRCLVIKRQLARVRSIFKLLCWLSSRNPAKEPPYIPKQFIISDVRQFTKSDVRYCDMYNIITKGWRTQRIQIGSDVNLADIDWNVFDVDSFLSNKIWALARQSAAKIISLIGLSESIPESDIASLCWEFID